MQESLLIDYEEATDMLVGIGDVARMIQVAPHTLRFWEKEFEFYLKPPRTVGKQRRYDTESIERLKTIRHLLKDVGYSIAGAKRVLLTRQAPAAGEMDLLPEPLLQKLYGVLRGEMALAHS